jgi:hypothetical protein
MKKKPTVKFGPNAILDALHPTLNTVILVVGIVVWAFNTFAQISYVKETNQQILGTIEARHKEAIDHSDMNRERMLAILTDLKDSMKSLEMRIISDRGKR